MSRLFKRTPPESLGKAKFNRERLEKLSFSERPKEEAERVSKAIVTFAESELSRLLKEIS